MHLENTANAKFPRRVVAWRGNYLIHRVHTVEVNELGVLRFKFEKSDGTVYTGPFYLCTTDSPMLASEAGLYGKFNGVKLEGTVSP